MFTFIFGKLAILDLATTVYGGYKTNDIGTFNNVNIKYVEITLTTQLRHIYILKTIYKYLDFIHLRLVGDSFSAATSSVCACFYSRVELFAEELLEYSAIIEICSVTISFMICKHSLTNKLVSVCMNISNFHPCLDF